MLIFPASSRQAICIIIRSRFARLDTTSALPFVRGRIQRGRSMISDELEQIEDINSFAKSKHVFNSQKLLIILVVMP